MLEAKDCVLAVVDVQGRLAQLMHEKEGLFRNIRILIQAARILDIPILWCQQVPEALGPTIPEIAELLSDMQPINKATFSCCGHDKFTGALKGLGRRHVLLCGIETHVCIYQTAVDLVAGGYEVHVAADAVSSRTAENKRIAIGRLTAAGANITCTEMLLFELLRTAEHPRFRAIARLIK